MAEPLIDQIIRKLKEVAELYNRLILVVAPSNIGKISPLQDVGQRLDVPVVNVNLELSRAMLELPEKQRALHARKLLEEIVSKLSGEIVLLDNIEILFDASLKLNPLRLLQLISRNRTLVVAWNGSIEKDHLTYASPDHPEYRRYPISGLSVICPALRSEKTG